jgi:hypothetical protein
VHGEAACGRRVVPLVQQHGAAALARQLIHLRSHGSGVAAMVAVAAVAATAPVAVAAVAAAVVVAVVAMAAQQCVLVVSCVSGRQWCCTQLNGHQGMTAR